MSGPRRFLPSISLLQAFEAAARTGSITAAARELTLTQSAVSRQIIALEAQLGVKLFHRERQTIRLTLGGDAYARDIRDALRRISTASLNLRANPSGGTLNLGVLPTFAARWLAPRLPAFLAAHPGITVNLMTRLTRFDFRTEPLDAAVHFGLPDWPGAEIDLIRSETVVPMCSPGLAARYRFESSAALRAAPLLHLASRPDAWERWLSHHDAPSEGVTGMLFDQFETLAQAAIAGLGVALLPIFMFEAELASGALVRAIDLPLTGPEAYHLVWPPDRSAHPPLAKFRAWLSADHAEAVDIDQPLVADLEMRNDRQRQEGHLQEGFRQDGAE